jgi:hypothetical protein
MPLMASAFLLAASCAAQQVRGFAWTSAGGAPLAFSQSSSWPLGEEAHFSGQRQSNTYRLATSSRAAPGTSLILCLVRAQGGAPTRVRLVLSPRREGSGPEELSFPRREKRVFFSLDWAPG